MAFTLEDGTGVAGANAYIDDAFFTAFFTDRGVTVSADVNVIQQAIVRATDHIEKTRRGVFLGYPSSSTQGLHWPATDAWDRHGRLLELVPAVVQKATAEYARITIAVGILAPSPIHSSPPEGVDGTIGAIPPGEVKREKVSTLDVEYLPSSQMRPDWMYIEIPPHPQADLWLDEVSRGPVQELARV